MAVLVYSPVSPQGRFLVWTCVALCSPVHAVTVPVGSCVGPVASGRHNFLGIIFFSFYSLSNSSSGEFPEPRGEGFDEDIPFTPECFKVSYSLNSVRLMKTFSLELSVPRSLTRLQQKISSWGFVSTFVCWLLCFFM